MGYAQKKLNKNMYKQFNLAVLVMLPIMYTILALIFFFKNELLVGAVLLLCAEVATIRVRMQFKDYETKTPRKRG